MVSVSTSPDLATETLSNLIVWSKYAKYVPELQRRETWDEIVLRNANMHLRRYPSLATEIAESYRLVFEKKVLPSMRSMQFAGKPIELSPVRLYNCCFMPMDHFLCFSELMFLLLSGCGVGYSIQNHDIDKLPEVRRSSKTRRYLIGDSIEGWADAVKALVRYHLDGHSRPLFDFGDIRPKGSPLKTAGGKAPGPDPLRICLEKVDEIFQRIPDGGRLRSIDVHDINCHIADAVLSGGIRRSSMIALFDIDDADMLAAKSGPWWVSNPQRALANNSAVIVRHKASRRVFERIWNSAKESGAGEPGIVFTNDKSFGVNPCCEVSLRPYQFCNLTTINASNIDDQEDLNERARVAAFIGTLQAGYTDFHYLRDIWKRTTEREALIGVSMTGIASGCVLNLDLKQAANIVKEENKRVADIIGIHSAARTTVVKPEGSSSLVVGSSSGIHAWHGRHYLRRVRVLKTEPTYEYFSRHMPSLIEDEIMKPERQAVISIPIKAPSGAITRDESSIQLLERVTHIWNDWVKEGHRKGDNINNVSTTVSVRDNEWDEVKNWMWDHREEYTGLAVLPYDGGSYQQAPFQEINEEEYNYYLDKVRPIDFTTMYEFDDATDVKGEAACFAGACEII